MFLTKYNSMVITALLAGLSWASQGAASCHEVDFSGTYMARNANAYDKDTQVQIQQDGCTLKVVEVKKSRSGDVEKIPWDLDISGQVFNAVPQRVVERNGGKDKNGFSYETMNSTRYTLNVSPIEKRDWFDQAEVKISGTLHLPELPPNKIENTLKFEARMTVFLVKGAKQPTSLSVHTIKFRLESVALPQPLAKGFLMGANYILEFFDYIDTVGIFTPTLVGLSRIKP